MKWDYKLDQSKRIEEVREMNRELALKIHNMNVQMDNKIKSSLYMECKYDIAVEILADLWNVSRDEVHNRVNLVFEDKKL